MNKPPKPVNPININKKGLDSVMLYLHTGNPGDVEIDRDYYKTLIVEEKEVSKYKRKGWSKTPSEALKEALSPPKEKDNGENKAADS